VHEEWTADGCVFDLELTKPDLDQLTSALYKPTNGDYNFQFGDEATFVNDDAARKKQKKGKKNAPSKNAKNDDNENDEKDANNSNQNDNDNKNQKKKDKNKK